MTITKNHPYAKKDWSYIYKLSPNKKFKVLQFYLEIKSDKKKKTFETIEKLANHFNINTKRPSKIKTNFDKLWKQIYPWVPINYSTNIFDERHKLTFHRWNLVQETKDEMIKILDKYPRAWYSTYKAKLKQKWIYEDRITAKSTFIYKKPIILKELWKEYKQKSYKNKKQASQSKKFWNKIYKKFDLIINLDWKSLEDIPTVQDNLDLFFSSKRISQAVEIQSWAIFKLAVEKSHNKTNALFIIKELVKTIKWIIWESTKILFLTDAGSEYLNNKKLRWMMITELDGSWIAKYLKKENCDMMITRFKQDNWYVENKNKYIEIACLDNYEITKMSESQFLECLQDYMDMNNYYLEWNDKYVYRWKWMTPAQNLSERFWADRANQLLTNLSANYIERKHKLSDKYCKLTVYEISNKMKPFLHILEDDSISLNSMFPKSFDSSYFIVEVRLFGFINFSS